MRDLYARLVLWLIRPALERAGPVGISTMVVGDASTWSEVRSEVRRCADGASRTSGAPDGLDRGQGKCGA